MSQASRVTYVSPNCVPTLTIHVTADAWETQPLPRDLRPVVVGFFDRRLKAPP